jgi:hypothetical protein
MLCIMCFYMVWRVGRGMDASSVSNDSPDYLRGRSWSLLPQSN